MNCNSVLRLYLAFPNYSQMEWLFFFSSFQIPQIAVANFIRVFYFVAVGAANCQTAAVYQLYPTIAILMTV